MNAIRVCLKRRALLMRGGRFGAFGFALMLGIVKPAAAKAAKDDFLYQEHPNDGKDCAQCKFFAPGNGNAATGSCAIVAGAIDRSGWCLAYAPRT
jgi:hypothetical protein